MLASTHPEEWVATLAVSNILFTSIFIGVIRDCVKNNVPLSVYPSRSAMHRTSDILLCQSRRVL